MLINTNPIKQKKDIKQSKPKVKTVIHRVKAEPKLQEKSTTVNGTISADEGFDGLSKVTVNVSGGGGSSTSVNWYAFSNNSKTYYTFIADTIDNVPVFEVDGVEGILCEGRGNIIIKNGVLTLLFPVRVTNDSSIPEEYQRDSTQDLVNNIDTVLNGDVEDNEHLAVREGCLYPTYRNIALSHVDINKISQYLTYKFHYIKDSETEYYNLSYYGLELWDTGPNPTVHYAHLVYENEGEFSSVTLCAEYNEGNYFTLQNNLPQSYKEYFKDTNEGNLYAMVNGYRGPGYRYLGRFKIEFED